MATTVATAAAARRKRWVRASRPRADAALARALLSAAPMRLALALSVAFAPLLSACDNAHHGDALPAAADQGGKADGAVGVEILGMLGPQAPVDATLPNKTARLGHVVWATAGSTIDLEVTRTGSAAKLDTVLHVWGPRDGQGRYAELIASDDDAGYGALSKLGGLTIEQDGFYLVEVTAGGKAPADLTNKAFRLALHCDGNCIASGPVVPAGLELRWVERSAEYRALALSSYAAATARIEQLAADGALPQHWAVVTDLDETVLSNLQYQRERAELGTEYSSSTWTAWVARREATLVPGAKAFLDRVHALGGTIAAVTNRKTIECADTEANLQALAVPFDLLLCRTGTSDKNPRFDAVQDGSADPQVPAAEVVLYVGDNIQDFPQLSQDLRHEGDEAFADFGGRFVLLPNPMYGSWTSN